MNRSHIISKARFFFLALAVALLPFSVRFCHLSLLAFLVLLLAEGNFSQRMQLIKINAMSWLLPLFFLVHLAGILWSSDASEGWVNVDKKLAFLLIPPIVISAKQFEKSELQKIAWVFVFACIFGTVLCFANAISSVTDMPLWNFGPSQRYVELHPDASNTWVYFSYISLASGIDIHPTYFAFYLMICIVVVLHPYTNERNGTSERLTAVLKLAVIGYLLIVIVLLSSRIVVLLTFVVTISGLLINQRSSMRWFAVSGALGVIVVMMFLNPVARYRNTQEYVVSSFTIPPPPLADNPINIRVSLWWLSMKAATEINPIIGNGTGSVNAKITELSDRYNAHNVLNTSDPHNQVFHTYIALGLAGVALLLAAFYLPLRVMFLAHEYLLCIAIAAFFVVGLTESVLELQKGIVPFTLFVALAGNYARSWQNSTEHPAYA